MSDQAERRLEEGSNRELSEDHKDEPNPSFGIRGLLKLILVFIIICSLIIWLYVVGGIILSLYLLATLIVMFPWIANEIKHKLYLVMHVLAITADPFFYYYVVLEKFGKDDPCIKIGGYEYLVHFDKDDPCIKIEGDEYRVHFDKDLGIIVSSFRTLFDILKFLYICFKLRQAYKELSKKGGIKIIPRVSKKLFFNLIQGKGRYLLANETVHFWMFIPLDLYAIFPIPQMLVISGGEEVKKKMKGFLVQYLIRAFRTCFLFVTATGNSGFLAHATWAIILFYILLYMEGAHIFGALWYYYAIDKVAKGNGSGNGYLYDSKAAKGNGSADGLYKDAIDSGFVTETDFWKKWPRCLAWGLRNLSGFGQELETSNDTWENIYSICMTNVGILMLVFLIGKMQADATRSIRIKEKWRQIRLWPRFKDITNDVKRKIKKDNNNNKSQNKRVKIDSLVSDLPQSTAREVKFQFGPKLLKKVKEFEKLSATSLKDLCDCMKPVVFPERTRIICEGDPIDEIVFVLEGKIWSYTNASISDSTLINERQNLVIGEELVAWAFPENGISSSSNPLPLSARTYQAYTNVEAFTILAIDLKRVLKGKE